MSAVHAMSAGIVGLFAIITLKATEWYSLPDVITVTPEQIVLGLLIVLFGVIGSRIL